MEGAVEEGKPKIQQVKISDLTKEEKKEYKKKIKEEKREGRKTKVPKHIKKRAEQRNKKH